MAKLNEKLLEKYCKVIINSAKPMCKLQALCSIKDSDIAISTQFAGKPYWPKSKEKLWTELIKKYGKSALLVQMNLENIDDNRLPKSGLIQVFVVGGDYNILEEEPNIKENVRGVHKSHFVVYHSIETLDKNIDIETLELDSFSGKALRYKTENGVSVINSTNVHEFERLLNEAGIFGDEIEEVYDFDDLFNLNQLSKLIKNENLKSLVDKTIELKKADIPASKINGYAHFSQDDERSPNTKMNELLVQLSSDEDMMFGDVGDIQVFTTIDDLKSLNDDSVIDSYYIFQCS